MSVCMYACMYGEASWPNCWMDFEETLQAWSLGTWQGFSLQRILNVALLVGENGIQSSIKKPLKKLWLCG